MTGQSAAFLAFKSLINVGKTMPYTTHLGMVNIPTIYSMVIWGMVYGIILPTSITQINAPAPAPSCAPLARPAVAAARPWPLAAATSAGGPRGSLRRYLRGMIKRGCDMRDLWENKPWLVAPRNQWTIHDYM